MRTTATLLAIAATYVFVIVCAAIVLALRARARARSARESYITRKTRLDDAGVTLQEPHIRALGTGMR